MSRRAPTRDVQWGGVAVALVSTAAVHVAMAMGFAAAPGVVTRPETSRADKSRWRHGEVAFERRRLELDCVSIAECEPHIEAEIVVPKFARLGTVQPDPEKLPEIQKYEEPEKDELAVNVEEKTPPKVKPKRLTDFLKRKAQLDRRKRRRKRKPPPKDLFNIDDDPRARPTAFEKITGRLDGTVYGKGVDQEKFDTYFGKLAYELHRVFNPPASLSRGQILKQLVRIKITAMNPDGTVVRYRVVRRAKKSGFTLSAEAALRQFMPTEGGTHRFPPPPQDVLDFVNKKGILIDLDGRLFE